MNNKDEVQAHIDREEARIRTDEAFHGIKSPAGAQPVMSDERIFEMPPDDILDAALKVENYFRGKNISGWKLAGLMDRYAPSSQVTGAQGEANNSELIERLREYAANNGYSHNDYADTMNEAADRLAFPHR